jgi:hypothetical protein
MPCLCGVTSFPGKSLLATNNNFSDTVFICIVNWLEDVVFSFFGYPKQSATHIMLRDLLTQHIMLRECLTQIR